MAALSFRPSSAPALCNALRTLVGGAAAAAGGEIAPGRRAVATAGENGAGADDERILVTGAKGQIGVELVPRLRTVFGDRNVIATDLEPCEHAHVHALDVVDRDTMEGIVRRNNVTMIVHLASLLSAVGEMKPQLALKINNKGLENVLEIARTTCVEGRQMKVFSPSSIAAFGTSTPKDATPDVTVMRPNTMYGVTKVFGELLGEYYAAKYGVDYRSIRYPGIISADAPPGGGTTDYAVDIFHQALTRGQYECFLREGTYLPMMYMDDCLKGTMMLIEADRSRLRKTTYNLASMSICPSELAGAIQRRIPGFSITYKADFREEIAQTWPRSIDDTCAREDWDWKPDFDMEAMTDAMLEKLGKKYGGGEDVHTVEARASGP